MREVGPDRVSGDGEFIIVRDIATGEPYRIRADQRLTSLIDAAQRRQHGVSGQMEITMESSLSPRDIQTRIRRGDAPADVAEAAGVPLEQIQAFAGPVLAERAYMAEQARKTTVRRRHVGGNGVLLGTLVDESILGRGGTPEDARWDAWRREDGRWTVVVRPADSEESAGFLFDAKSRYVLPDDKAGHDLVGDIAHPEESADMAIADAVRHNDAERETSEPEPLESTSDAASEPDNPTLFEPVSAGVHSLKEARDRRAQEQLSLVEPVAEADEPSADDAEAFVEEEPIAVPHTAAPGKKKNERRRVPSWDEIMFGGRD